MFLDLVTFNSSNSKSDPDDLVGPAAWHLPAAPRTAIYFRRFHSTMNKGLLLSSGHVHTSRRSQMILPGYNRTRKVAVQLFRSHSRASKANPCVSLPSNVSFRPVVRKSVNPSQLYRTARLPPKSN